MVKCEIILRTQLSIDSTVVTLFFIGVRAVLINSLRKGKFV